MSGTVTDDELAELDPDRHDDSYPALLARRISGRFEVDEWGYDADLVAGLAPLGALRQSAEVLGADHLPEIGPALVVTNRRMAPVEPLLLAAALGRASGRPVRFASVPDLVPIGPLLRRLGGVPGNEHDLRSLLRAGDIVIRPLAFDLRRPFGPGRPVANALAVAQAVGAPIIPVRVEGFELGRHRLVTIGQPIVTRRRQALDDAALAAAVLDRLAVPEPQSA